MDKNAKLLNRPVDSDTKILMEDLVQFKEFIGLMELWSWEGITASSVILLREDVGDWDKDKLIKGIFDQINQPIDPKATYKVTGDYVYVNYGFKTKD